MGGQGRVYGASVELGGHELRLGRVKRDFVQLVIGGGRAPIFPNAFCLTCQSTLRNEAARALCLLNWVTVLLRGGHDEAGLLLEVSLALPGAEKFSRAEDHLVKGVTAGRVFF